MKLSEVRALLRTINSCEVPMTLEQARELVRSYGIPDGLHEIQARKLINSHTNVRQRLDCLKAWAMVQSADPRGSSKEHSDRRRVV